MYQTYKRHPRGCVVPYWRVSNGPAEGGYDCDTWDRARFLEFVLNHADEELLDEAHEWAAFADTRKTFNLGELE